MRFSVLSSAIGLPGLALAAALFITKPGQPPAGGNPVVTAAPSVPETNALSSSGSVAPGVSPRVSPEEPVPSPPEDVLPVPAGDVPANEHPGVETAPPTNWHEELQALRELTMRDPGSALVQVSGMPTKEERDEALLAVCSQWAQFDPALALTTAWAMQRNSLESPGMGPGLENLARRWAEQDLAAAVAWARAQPVDENDSRRDRVIMGLAAVWSKTSPRDAADLVVDQIPPGSLQVQAAMTLLDAWAQRDLPAAKAWAEQFPEGNLRETALAKLDRFASAQGR